MRNSLEEAYNKDYYDHYSNPTSGSYLKARRTLGLLLVLALNQYGRFTATIGS